MAKVLVFGIFDGVHPGHIDFFRQAKKCDNFLIVVVGRPLVSKKFKNKIPKHSLGKRIKNVRDIKYVDKVIPGDKQQGGYEVILREKPNIICLGYDQKELTKNLTDWIMANRLDVEVKILKPYKSDQFHTEIIDKNKE